MQPPHLFDAKQQPLSSLSLSSLFLSLVPLSRCSANSGLITRELSSIVRPVPVLFVSTYPHVTENLENRR